MYEDGMDLDLSLDFDSSIDESTLSEQEINDILGVEYAVENNEIGGLEEEANSPSLERLKKLKQNNYKKEQAKKLAEIKARKLAEERQKRVEIQKQLQKESYTETLKRDYSAERSTTVKESVPSGGGIFSSHTQTYSENIGESQHSESIRRYTSSQRVDSLGQDEGREGSSYQEEPINAAYKERNQYDSDTYETQRKEIPSNKQHQMDESSVVRNGGDSSNKKSTYYSQRSEIPFQNSSSNENTSQYRPTFESSSTQEQSAQRLEQFRKPVSVSEERRVEQPSYVEEKAPSYYKEATYVHESTPVETTHKQSSSVKSPSLSSLSYSEGSTERSEVPQQTVRVHVPNKEDVVYTSQASNEPIYEEKNTYRENITNPSKSGKIGEIQRKNDSVQSTSVPNFDTKKEIYEQSVQREVQSVPSTSKVEVAWSNPIEKAATNRSDSVVSSSLNNTNPLPFDMKKMDMKQAYAVEPDVSFAQNRQAVHRSTLFENTGNTPTQDTFSRNVAGTITEAGVFVGCDVILPTESKGQAAFNSRKEESVIQPELKPAEDASRMSEVVSPKEVEASSVISRYTSDYKEGVAIPENAQMRNVSQKEIAESIPKQVDASILYAASADMDTNAERVVLSNEGSRPSVASGESEVQMVASVKDTQSLLNRTPEGNFISTVSQKEVPYQSDNQTYKIREDVIVSTDKSIKVFEENKTFGLNTPERIIHEEGKRDAVAIDFSEFLEKPELIRAAFEGMLEHINARNAVDFNTDEKRFVALTDAPGEFGKSFVSEDSSERLARVVDITPEQKIALESALKSAGIGVSLADYARDSGVVFRSVDKESSVDYMVKDSEGYSLVSKSINTTSKEVTLSGQKEKESDKDKEGPVSEETKQGETSEYRSILEASRRKFARENGQMWKDVCQSSQIVIGAITSNLTPDDDAGYQAYQRGKGVVASANNFLCYWGSSATYNMLSDRAIVLSNTANLVSSLCLDMGSVPEGLSIAMNTGTSMIGKLNLTDLSLSKDELREKLEAIEGLSNRQIKNILANTTEIKQMLEARQLLFDFSTQTGKLSEGMLDFIASAEFFNPTMFSGEFTSAIATYFASSKDELLRSVNPANMTPKEIKKLLRMDARNKANGLVGLSEADVGLLKLLQKRKTTSNVLGKNRSSHGVFNKMGSLLKKAKNTFIRLDDASAEGLRHIFKIYDGGKTAVTMFKLGGRMTSWTVKFAGRVVFLNPVSRYVGRKVKQGVTIVKNTASTAIKSTKAAKALSSGKKAVKGAIEKNKQINALKSKAQKIKQAKNAVGKKVSNINRSRKKVTRKIKSGAGKVGKVLRTPGKIFFAPFNAVAKLLSKITNFVKGKILLPLAGIVAVFLLIYMLLMTISAILISIVGTSETTIMLDASGVQALVNNLNEKTNDVYSNAKSVATGSPITNKVYDNTRLYCYGSPKYHGDPTSEYYHNGATIDKSLLNGWHVYYLDSQGNVLGSNVSNVKDIISIACAMMQNQSDDVDEYQHLVNDMWGGMVPVITARESDIYHTEYSTDKYPKNGSTYYCTDSGFYSKYDEISAQGVCFYDTVAPRHLQNANDAGYICTGKGCCYNEWDEWVLTCNTSEHTHGYGCSYTRCGHNCANDGCTPHLFYVDGCIDSCNHRAYVQYSYFDCNHTHTSSCCSKTAHTHSREAGCYRHDLHRDYYCPGHSALHCSYGYRDINVYITLLQKEDVYKSTINSDKCVITYKVPTNYNCTTFENRQATINFQRHWDGYKKRMKHFFNNGAWDWDKHSAYSMMNPETGCMECNIPNVQGGSFNPGTSSVSRCQGIIEWADRLFNADWYELYGVSVYSSDSGLAPGGGTLTPEERQAIEADIVARFGDIGTARQSFVDFALDYVGSISYWFGGKPSSKSWDSRWGTTAPQSDPYYIYNRNKGRTVLGLDCSGFVGWCYWNTFDVQPGCSTGNFTTSLGLSQTSFMNLKPGDIGLSSVPGSSSNHIGIFVGFDENGKALWVHCNGSTANVAVNNYNGFRYYYSLLP